MNEIHDSVCLCLSFHIDVLLLLLLLFFVRQFFDALYFPREQINVPDVTYSARKSCIFKVASSLWRANSFAWNISTCQFKCIIIVIAIVIVVIIDTIFRRLQNLIFSNNKCGERTNAHALVLALTFALLISARHILNLTKQNTHISSVLYEE